MRGERRFQLTHCFAKFFVYCLFTKTKQVVVTEVLVVNREIYMYLLQLGSEEVYNGASHRLNWAIPPLR